MLPLITRLLIPSHFTSFPWEKQSQRPAIFFSTRICLIPKLPRSISVSAGASPEHGTILCTKPRLTEEGDETCSPCPSPFLQREETRRRENKMNRWFVGHSIVLHSIVTFGRRWRRVEVVFGMRPRNGLIPWWCSELRSQGAVGLGMGVGDDAGLSRLRLTLKPSLRCSCVLRACR